MDVRVHNNRSKKTRFPTGTESNRIISWKTNDLTLHFQTDIISDFVYFSFEPKKRGKNEVQNDCQIRNQRLRY